MSTGTEEQKPDQPNDSTIMKCLKQLPRIGGGSFAISIVEYILVKRKFRITLATPLMFTRDVLNKTFTVLGEHFAKLSSYLHHLYMLMDFADYITITKQNLIDPSVEIITSGVNFIQGYSSMMNIYEHPTLVICGTIGLTAGIIYVVKRYDHAKVIHKLNQWYPLKK